MSRILGFLYGLAAYAAFLVVFLYAIGFVGNFAVPKTIDTGDGSWVPALFVDLILLGVFAVQHSGMARSGFKKWLTRIVPASIERSTYVLLSSAVLALLYWQWRPIPLVIWDASGTAVATVLWILFWTGWLIVLGGSFMISHFDLFGLRQVTMPLLGKPYSPVAFKTSMLYKYVRHPLMTGFLIAFWAAPVMTAGHLLFAVATTGYILLALQLEERDLLAAHGDSYRSYKGSVSMLFPWPKGRR